MQDGTMERIKGYDSKAVWRSIADPKLRRQMELAENAVQVLNKPDPAIVSLTQDAIWRRRVAYFLLLFSALVIAVLPWGVRPVVDYVLDTLFPGSSEHGL